MRTETTTLEVNGIELQEGDCLWRYKAMNLWDKRPSDYDPHDDVLAVTAEQLAEKFPDVVDGADADTVHADFVANPGIYDDSGKMNYHAMNVESVGETGGYRKVTLKDWKEETTFVFKETPPETDLKDDGSYYTFEPFSALEEHLGLTILPTTGDDDGN